MIRLRGLSLLQRNGSQRKPLYSLKIITGCFFYANKFRYGRYGAPDYNKHLCDSRAIVQQWCDVTPSQLLQNKWCMCYIFHIGKRILIKQAEPNYFRQNMLVYLVYISKKFAIEGMHWLHRQHMLQPVCAEIGCKNNHSRLTAWIKWISTGILTTS